MPREREVEAHYTSYAHQQAAAQFGMWVFLATEVLFFASFFTAWAYYRAVYPEGFTAGTRHMDVTIGTINTFVLITSSFLVGGAVHLVRTGRVGRAGLALWGAMLLGVLFLVLKGVEYAEHVRDGALPGMWFTLSEETNPGTQLFLTLYWLMTGLHAIHVTVGVGLLGWVGFEAVSGGYTAERHTPLEVAGLYWHFVDVVWVFLYPMLYLVGG